MPEWVQLVSAPSDIDAHLIVGRLEEEGIEATTERNRTGAGDFLFGGSNPHAPVAVLVHPDRVEDARAVLEAEPVPIDEPEADPAGGLDEGPETYASPRRGTSPAVWLAVAIVLVLILASSDAIRRAIGL